MSLTPPVLPLDPSPLRDRVVAITGGAQGIGRAIAQAVLGAGGRVAIGDLDRDAGAACLAEWDVGDRACFSRSMSLARRRCAVSSPRPSHA